MSSMPSRLPLSTALLALAAAACGGGDAPPASETGAAPASRPAARATSDVVRTADPAERGYTAADFPRVQEIAPRAESLRDSAIRRTYADLSGDLVGR
jgi:hypothetical protein